MEIENTYKFKQWKQTLQQNNICLEGYEVLNAIYKSDNQLLFAFLRAKMRTPEGTYLPSLVFLRGHFVAVLVHITEIATNKSWTLLVKQRRVATGAFFYEFPCGMTDAESDIYKVAQKELYEETTLEVRRDELILLNSAPYFTSQGLLDEGGYFMACQKHLSTAELKRFHLKQAGATNENEHITVLCVPLDEAPKYFNHVTGLLHWHLYKTFLRT